MRREPGTHESDFNMKIGAGLLWCVGTMMLITKHFTERRAHKHILGRRRLKAHSLFVLADSQTCAVAVVFCRSGWMVWMICNAAELTSNGHRQDDSDS